MFTGECGSLECVDYNDDGLFCPNFGSELTFESTAGTTYYIRVFGHNDDENGPFTLIVIGGENIGIKNVPIDWNRDGVADLSDAVGVLNHLFLGGDGFACGDLANAGTVAVNDSNGDGTVDRSDAVGLLNFLFLGGLQPQSAAAAGDDDCSLMQDCADGVEDACG